jgi:hypothetical protein
MIRERRNELAMYGIDEHLDNLVRHINLVRESCTLLGRRLIKQGRTDFGRLLIARGFRHDASKFSGIEWDYLHTGPDVPEEKLSAAIAQHVRTNDHHPEFWGGVENMPEIATVEMVCDWYARSQEFGTGLRDWIEQEAIDKYKIKKDSDQHKWIMATIDLLLQDPFKKDEPTPVPKTRKKRAKVSAQ